MYYIDVAAGSCPPGCKKGREEKLNFALAASTAEKGFAGNQYLPLAKDQPRLWSATTARRRSTYLATTSKLELGLLCYLCSIPFPESQSSAEACPMSAVLWVLAGLVTSTSAWLTPGHPAVLFTSAIGTLIAMALAMMADLLPIVLYGALITIPVVLSFVVIWGTVIALVAVPIWMACTACISCELEHEKRQSYISRATAIFSCDLIGLWLYISWIASQNDLTRQGELVFGTMLPFAYLYDFDKTPDSVGRTATLCAGGLMLLACLRPPIEWLVRRWWSN